MKDIITLENGVKIVLEPIDYVRSASFGIWVGSGSIYENTENNGASHFLEHMLFKGTKTYTASQLAELMDSIGGQMNAVTSKGYTCFYARTLSEHIEKGFEILADMVVNSTITKEDFDMEKNVILEELAMSEDDPWDILSEQLSKYIWNDSNYGLPILGTKESLDKLTNIALREYKEKMYCGKRIVVSICGKYDKDKFVQKVTNCFSQLPTGQAIENENELPFKRGLIINECEREQTYLTVAFNSLSTQDPLRYALSVLNCIAGSSSSSRLFQQIREKSALAYSIYSDVAILKNGGVFSVSASVNPTNAKRTVEEIIDVLSEIKENGVTEIELQRAKENIKSTLLMSTESTNGRSNKNGRTLLLGLHDITEDEIIEKVNAITIENVKSLANRIFDFDNMAISVVGVVEDKEYFSQFDR